MGQVSIYLNMFFSVARMPLTVKSLQISLPVDHVLWYVALSMWVLQDAFD